MERDEFLGSTWRDGLALADAAEAKGLAAPVPSCPGWTVADLVWHMGEVHYFWATAVETGMTDPSEYVSPPRPGDDELLAWYRAGVDRAVKLLTETPPDRPVWSWSSGTDAAWVVRRMAHETAVHRWDAGAYDIEPELAVDGVDEFFAYFATGPVDGSVHLHATDADGEWLVTDGEAGLDVRREHAKGDAAVRGKASDLLLLLWRRVPLDDRFEVFGDQPVAERLVTTPDLA